MDSKESSIDYSEEKSPERGDRSGDSKEDGAKESTPETNELEKSEILQLVMQFATGSDFEKDFEDFAEANHKPFLPLLDFKGGEEHPVEWHTIYMDYLNTFEGKIERFIQSSGYNINDFYDRARDIIDDNETFGETRFFLEALLATAEYETFIFLMKGELFCKHKPKEGMVSAINEEDGNNGAATAGSDAK
jgi:hypothetical protein